MKVNIFLPTQTINIVYPKEDNMIIVPITKRVEIILSTQVWLISRMGIKYKEMVERNFFLQIQRSNIVHPNVENMVVVPNHNRNGDYYENPSLSYFMDELWL